MVIRENRERKGDNISHVWFERVVGDTGLAAPHWTKGNGTNSLHATIR
jgi:hypothetical protein